MQQVITHWWEVDSADTIEGLKRQPEIIRAAQLLQEGGLVAFPTETVYGLGADATSQAAVAQIFEAKGRPSDNPLIIHLGSPEQLARWVKEVPTVAEICMEHFCPGPLTLVLPHNGQIADNVTAGLDTVAVRFPSHPVAMALLQAADIPVAAPSANRSGKPSPTQAQHVWHDLSGRFHVLLDGGEAGVGIESTVLDVTGDVPMLLRPGGITLEQLRYVLGDVEVDPNLYSEKSKPRSPGMKYRHYAPSGEMFLVHGEPLKVVGRVNRMVKEDIRQGKRVGVLTTEERKHYFKQANRVIACGSRSDPESVARGLYDALRTFDQEKIDVIYAETFPERGIFSSVMNRMRKAAEGRMIRV
ncbi:L-threonylcarbamoyladenylate synthase [Croceifilum oryzae]|uniref:Threonylcarbamoyl-AMP synthase n=1 Tax=Croceifilum oryzae TaxID=1553429 RepID=A0AAJ1TH59_9BACL|nr:L-threonylcarbamoyladenylate synthase [Croceifilum oryzae]